MAIRGVKRFMADQEVTIQLPEVRENERNAHRKIAIVGAGPAGLSCAYFLARLGYRPAVFEGAARPGGMLVQAIPAYRLPREIVAREVRMIEHMGVELFTNIWLGRTSRSRSLRAEGYDAVFLGVGAPPGVKLGMPGEDARGWTTPSPSSAPTTSADRWRWARRSWSSAAGTRPSTPPAPPCGSAQSGSPWSIAAAAKRCRPMKRKWRKRNAKASCCGC